MSSCDNPREYLAALVIEIAKVMENVTYRRYMEPRLSTREKAQLWALRSQALFGDAPDDYEVKEKQENRKNSETEKSTSKRISSVTGFSLPLPPTHWYQFSARFYFAAWKALRGTMTPQVAAETFCTEFFYLLKLHSVPAMLPLMESALNTARAKATAIINHTNTTSTSSTSPVAEGGIVDSDHRIRELKVCNDGFHVRGCFEDPVVIAFIWLCRAHCIPCEVVFEPLPVKSSLGEENLFLVKSLKYGTIVTEPLAAFFLCVKLYLPHSDHWLGVLPLSQTNTSSSSSYADHAIERSTWMEYMQHILTDLRIPLLQYMREVLWQQKLNEKSKGLKLSPRRTGRGSQLEMKRTSFDLLRSRDDISRTVMSSIIRFENFAIHYYKKRSKCTISVAELCVAAYGYIFCTNPLSSPLFPLAVVIPSVSKQIGMNIDSKLTQRGSLLTGALSVEPMRMSPLNTTALLNGIPKKYQEIATQILHGANATQTAAPMTFRINEENTGIENMNKKKVSPFGIKFLHVDSAWSGVAAGTSQAAVEVIDCLIQTNCSPMRHRFAQILSYAWRTANEQCIGFPFLVLDKEQQAFLAPSNVESSAFARERASWNEESIVKMARVYWSKLRTAFGMPSSSSSSSEQRVYSGLMSRL
ncbi:uncharacterized protein TM35_000034330 [Trypanosoma theileri]|uniref:Uncharacterized protein n=1 Tax=Trypanosoma theileri TaxID=67003 RepID=A0A1X0P8C5_9TRYP|nr:uncharacterized protein TM35_000034330 [Trypanosoma theileri]ORC92680.1 hypothetical protein TM35_000034330 [Trypanosoma theileri]